MIKAIETTYAGHKFRSRTEARWAVLFDYIGLPWLYEEQGYDLDGTLYLPDFWLPELNVWFEVKATEPDAPSWYKAQQLTKASGRPCFIGWNLHKPAVTVGEGPADHEQYIIWPCGHCGKVSITHSTCLVASVMLEKRGDTKWAREVLELSGYWACRCSFTNQRILINGDLFEDAHTLARQARFEHGETPTRRMG